MTNISLQSFVLINVIVIIIMVYGIYKLRNTQYKYFSFSFAIIILASMISIIESYLRHYEKNSDIYKIFHRLQFIMTILSLLSLPIVRLNEYRKGRVPEYEVKRLWLGVGIAIFLVSSLIIMEILL